MPAGPQQFDLQVYDSYQTRDPAASLEGTDIRGSVTVTINWNAGGTDVTEPAVAFSAAQWSEAGSGPLAIFDEAVGGDLQPIGMVSWKVSTQFVKTMEPDTPNKRYRWTITPMVELIRTVLSTVGNPPDAEVAYTASDTAQGGWIPQA